MDPEANAGAEVGAQAEFEVSIGAGPDTGSGDELKAGASPTCSCSWAANGGAPR